MMAPLACGLLVGVSLGLTGGGGSIFAVPLLVYALGLPMAVAVGLSLAAVGLTAGFGVGLQWRNVEWRVGLVFAAAGMALAPGGAALGRLLSPALALTAFAVLMGVAGWRMWVGKSGDALATGPCRPHGEGRLRLACYSRLLAAGAAAGVLSGLFGVGGGFIIVPALVFVAGLPIHQAVPSSLLVIFLISISGVASHMFHGADFPRLLSALFVSGGFLGMLGGSRLRDRLPPAKLRSVFAVGMWLVGAWMLWRNVPALLPRNHSFP